jgi:hypothetical protein
MEQAGFSRPNSRGEGRDMKLVVITAPKGLAGALKKLFGMEK